jgi:hypothetical protein
VLLKDGAHITDKVDVGSATESRSASEANAQSPTEKQQQSLHEIV